MRIQLKSAAFGLAVALGIAGVAQASQQTAQPTQLEVPSMGQDMGASQMMGQPDQGSMMNDPEMRERMASMMERCQHDVADGC